MSATDTKKMLGGDGVMRFIDSTSTIPAASGYLFDYLIVNEPCVLSGLTDENNVNVLQASQWNLSGKTLYTGMILIGKNNARIKAVTVISGSVIGYQSRDRGNLRV